MGFSWTEEVAIGQASDELKDGFVVSGCPLEVLNTRFELDRDETRDEDNMPVYTAVAEVHGRCICLASLIYHHESSEWVFHAKEGRLEGALFSILAEGQSEAQGLVPLGERTWRAEKEGGSPCSMTLTAVNADGTFEWYDGKAWRAYEPAVQTQLREVHRGALARTGVSLTLEVKIGAHRYRIDLAKMTQLNVKYKTERQVRWLDAASTSASESFGGCIVAGPRGDAETCCVAAFPAGEYRDEWNELRTRAEAGHLSTATVYIRSGDPRFGSHEPDPATPGSCYCAKLYGSPQRWGCGWFAREYIANVERAVEAGQTLVVLYKEGHLQSCDAEGSKFPETQTISGEVDWDQLATHEHDRTGFHTGLGESQTAEVAWLKHKGYSFLRSDVTYVVPGVELSPAKFIAITTAEGPVAAVDVVRTAAIEAKQHLDSLQEQLRTSPAVDEECCERRDAARTKFIAAAAALSTAVAPDSPLDNRMLRGRSASHSNPRGQISQPQHQVAWHRTKEQARQLSLSAADCHRIIDTGQLDRTVEALQVLQKRHQDLRQEMDDCNAHIVLLEGELRKIASSKEHARVTPEQRVGRDRLLGKSMEDWSEAEVQKWIALIGLPAEHDIVLEALTADKWDGEELRDMTKSSLKRALKKAGADDPTSLAEQTLTLHQAAHGEATAQGKLVKAKTQLATARQTLCDNSVAIRTQMEGLMLLASQHFPELQHSNEDVKRFMGSDGLRRPERRLNDYDNPLLLMIGRFEVTHAKYNGVDVCLKKFPLQGDMRSYMKEILNVQQLRHRNIIKYSAVFLDAGSMHIEMEYCKHGSLTQWMRDTNPDTAQKQSVLRQVLSALACMHDQGIVHCDIKGDNILIAEDGTARICDFELSKDLGAADPSTLVGGTLGFMAPEVQSREAQPSKASDMYAFGVLVLNTLYPPVAGQLYPQLNVDVVDDPELKKSLALLMARNPSKRPTAVKLQAEAFFDVDWLAEERVPLPPEWTSVSDSAGVDFVDVPDKCSFFEDKIKQSAKVTVQTKPAQKLDGLRVHRVVRVENAPLYKKYLQKRARISSRLEATRAAGHDVVRLQEHAPDWLAAKAGFPAVIDSDCNEFWAWHGTSAAIDIPYVDGTEERHETWKVLARHGFDERVGGDSNGGMYGKGIYLADAASKANQYATAPICKKHQTNADGHHCMLSCRVTMGNPYMTPGKMSGQRRPPCNPATPGVPYDSVFAKEGVTENGHGKQFHNEYVVFDGAQVYPEYVIWYTK